MSSTGFTILYGWSLCLINSQYSGFRSTRIELLQRTAHYFQGNVTSGDYMVRIDTESPNPSLYIKVIIYPEEVVTEDEKAKQVKKLIDPDPFVGLI